MAKKMLIDDTQPEETRVVVLDGNKIEDVEFESSYRKQIKGNVYLAKVMRIEPSLQAAFVDYGGNRHGFLAFGEIHPDYYHISAEQLAEYEKETDIIIENKKQFIKEREAERAKIREEKALKRAQYMAEHNQTENEQPSQEETDSTVCSSTPEAKNDSSEPSENITEPTATITDEPAVEQNVITAETSVTEEQNFDISENQNDGKKKTSRRSRRKPSPTTMADSEVAEEDKISEEVSPVQENYIENEERAENDNNINDEDIPEEDDDNEYDFEAQRKLILMRKLYHNSNIQDVIKEGQILLVQVVKEERGNKGAALTTYLSLAGRYCVLMPNRIKSGGVSRKITNSQDRKRLKGIIKDLPISKDMSLIVRTAGEEKTKADITRDYNYLIRTWNQIRIDSLKNQAPTLIYEEGNLIKRALRDMFTKDVSEIIIDGDNAFKAARNFMKILSPHNMKKLKSCHPNEAPLFQRYQIETQLDKLHDPNVPLASGGYLVINPTEALVSIDVNSGKATKEKDLEETALKTNLEAADEIAKQLRMRNLAGLVVIDFIDMDEPKNNLAIEKRMKEAMKNDRARVQISKMSCFGLLEISRQRMHSSFLESNYHTCPYCHGRGIVRTIESGAMSILRIIEEEGSKNRSSMINVFLPTEYAVYLLNQKRASLHDIEKRYKMSVIISADDSVKNISEYRIERTKAQKIEESEEQVAEEVVSDSVESGEENFDNYEPRRRFDFRGRRGRFDRRFRRKDRSSDTYQQPEDTNTPTENSTETVEENTGKRKVSWWKKLING
ncbi:MAG: Rne/Rng family ribonuclease [Alphaproteobacteria bacterium]|nr:Rne/Rng family ribonuclease [Alphaproteobacteria bacterium]